MGRADWSAFAYRLPYELWITIAAKLRFVIGHVEAVELTFVDLETQKSAPPITSTDARKIESLVTILRSSEATDDHKCADTGTIDLRLADGSTWNIGVLAGHDPNYYEFRAYRGSNYKIFRVQREPFLKALRDFGITEIDLGQPE